MKKLIAYLIIFLLMAMPTWSYAATCTFQSGGVDLLWSTVGNWDCGHVPTADEDVIIPNLVAVMDVARIPAASGSLASLTATTGGQITINMSSSGPCEASGSCGIYVTGDVQAGTKNTGFIRTSGIGTGHTLNLAATNFIGGTESSATCVYLDSTGSPTITITGHAKGGTGQTTAGVLVAAVNTVTISNGAEGGTGAGVSSYGVMNNSTGTVTITGNITAGGATLCYGVYNSSTGNVVLVNSNIINSAVSLALGGKPPAFNPGNTYYMHWWTGAGNTIAAPNTYYYQNTDPGVANVKAGETYYFNSGTVKTGTYSAGGGGAWAN